MEHEVEISRVAQGGGGVCRIDGQVCFVTYGLPGDHARIKITKKAKSVLHAVVDEVTTPSRDRTEPPCPHFGTCGGCNWLHFAYPAQAEWKRTIISDCMARIAKVNDVEVEWAEDASLRLGYRTRAQFHCKEGRVGFYARDSHDIVDIEACPLCHDALNKALQRLRKVRITGTVELVANPDGEEVLAWTQKPHRRLAQAFEAHEWAAWGKQRTAFEYDGMLILNGTFSQSSLLLNRLLRKTVQEMVGEPKSLLDLYCGNGNLSLPLASKMRVVGIDNDQAVVAAAAEHGVGEYRSGSEKNIKKAILAEPWDIILLDPPRTGAKAIAKTLGQSAAKAIVYTSCDPATLARDVKTITEAGWHITRTIAVDMFPNTAHIETVCRLER